MGKLAPRKKNMMNGKKSNQNMTTSPKTTMTDSKDQPSQIKKKGNRSKPMKGKNQKKKILGKRPRRGNPKHHIDYKKRHEMAVKQDKKLMKKFVYQVPETPEPIKTPTIDTTQLINLELIDAAVAGLRKLPVHGKTERKSLHDITDTDERYIYLQVTLCKLPKVTEDFHLTGPSTVSVYLPHTLVTDNTEVILITKDLQRGVKKDHQNSLNHFKDLLNKHDAASLINEVIPLRQLKVEYREYEAKRLLANRTDVLLCDDTIMRFIPKFLTKHFYTKKKLPVQVNLKAKDLQHEVLTALSVSKLFLSMKGNSSIMKIGRLGQTDEQIKGNILAAVEKLALHAPGKWDNIQSLSLKQEKTTSIPVYVKMESLNSVKEIPARTLYPGKVISDSISTLPGRCVTVFPDGNVTVTRLADSKDRLREKKSVSTETKEPDTKSGKKRKREKKSASKNNAETQKDEMEGNITKKETKEKPTKRRKTEKKNSKDKKQKKVHGSDSEGSGSDSDLGEDDLEEQENMYLRQLSQNRQESTGNQEEEEDSEEDVWADSESDVEDSD